MPVVIYTRKDFYLVEAVNEKIEFIISAGLVDFWQLQDVNDQLLKVKDIKYPEPLTTNHLMASFHILLSGYITSLFVLALEFFKYKITKSGRFYHLHRKALLILRRRLFK